MADADDGAGEDRAGDRDGVTRVRRGELSPRAPATSCIRIVMRRLSHLFAATALCPLALQAQRLELAPATVAPSPPNGGWCFGVKLHPRDRCVYFEILEIGARFRASGQTDHSTRDPAHAYPTLDDHGYLALGLARRIVDHSALGVVGEYGAGGGERQSLGVRFDQQLSERARLDFTAGALRVETHQRGVTRRRTESGTFVDGAVRASDLFVIQARVDHIPGDGALVKPATATYVGMRVEGGGAVKTTLVGVAILAVLEFIVFFGGGAD